MPPVRECVDHRHHRTQLGALYLHVIIIILCIWVTIQYPFGDAEAGNDSLCFSGLSSRYDAVIDADMTLLDTAYDYDSVMHSNGYEFGDVWSIPTIIPFYLAARIGQRNTLSRMDIERIQIHYRCLDPVKILFFTS
jgi:Astacin (Peptidase family M12A)